MDDWETLLGELHAWDIRLIMDLVVNHTSDEHEWFVRSRENDPAYDEFSTPTFEGERLLVVLNFADEPTPVEFPAADVGVDPEASADLLLANYDVEAETTVADLLDDTLRPWEARVYHVA